MAKQYPASTDQACRTRDASDATGNAFDMLARAFAGVPGVSRANVFGFSALKIHGKVFALVADGHLVVKLAPDRITALTTSGHGELFVGHGKTMRAWVRLTNSEMHTVLPFAEEACTVVDAT